MSARGGLNKESEVRHTDSTSCGFPRPAPRYGERFDRAAE
jgi:hypothetical protein